MRTSAALPLLVLTSGLLMAQRQAPVPPSTKPGSVEGVVTNSVNGEPVKKAIVILQGAGQNHQETTDAAGHFHFDKIDPGSYSIQANGEGFAVTTGVLKAIKVAEEENVKDVALQLVPLAHVSGHVFDEDGDPIMLASVQAVRYGFNAGRRQLMPAGFANSNDLGEFQFSGLEPGRYFFFANARPRAPNLPPRTRFLGAVTEYPRTYYPNATEPGQAAVADLAPGATLASLDFRLRKVPAFHVRGKVVDSSGQPVHDASVAWMPGNDGPPMGRISNVQTANDGTFDIFPVAPGTYVLSSMRSLRQDGSAGELARETITITDQDLNGVGLVFSPGVTINGRFTVEGAAPSQINGQVFLHGTQASGSDFQGQVAPDGTLAIQNVWPGAYQMDVFTGASGLYVKSIRYGDTDVSSGSLTVIQGSAGALTVVLGTDGGQVQGTVQTSSGTPAHGMVTLAPDGDLPGRRDLIKQTSLDPIGNFKFVDIAPGEYKVFAWEDQLPDVVDVFDFRKALASHAASVTVGPNSHESVQVQAISAEEAEAERKKLQW